MPHYTVTVKSKDSKKKIQIKVLAPSIEDVPNEMISKYDILDITRENQCPLPTEAGYSKAKPRKI